MHKRKTGRSKHIDFILLDVVCVEISFILAYLIRSHAGGFKAADSYYLINVMLLLMHFCVVFWTECYSGIIRRGYLKELKQVVKHNCFMLGGVLIILFGMKESETYSRLVVGYFFVIDIVLMYVVRILWKRFLFTRNKKEKNSSKVIIAVTKGSAEEVLLRFGQCEYENISVEGLFILDEDMKNQEILGTRVLGGKKEMYEFVRTNVIDRVFLQYPGDDLREIIDNLLIMGVITHVSVNAFLSGAPNLVVENVNDYTVITTSINLMSFKQKVIKRCMDILASIPGLIITGILTIILGPIIYIQSPGPIFFKQTRIGRNGRHFKMYKFRSMYMDAEERKKELMAENKMNGLMFKMDNDPRITPIGKFIRKTSLDEFPQFINIFKGDMSLVGTRPPTEDEYLQYEMHHKSRLAIKPGLTGMWQSSGRSDITDFEEVVRLDNEYIRNFSLGLDIKIIFKTLWSVVSRKGSV
mgnify:CR=1 FL=1